MIKFGRRNGVYSDFSNFALFDIHYDGRVYRCSEAAWQSLKVLDSSEREKFKYMDGKTSKSAGRHVALRPDWEDVKFDLMVDVLKSKFSNNGYLKALLLSTKDEELVENTTGWHDNIWGNCECPKCINTPGSNLLGKALMKVRDFLKEQ